MIGRFLIFFVKIYRRLISPLFPPVCIYRPTCSQYMIDAIQQRGVWAGVTMGLWRICRCHPFARGGWDPVLPRPGSKSVPPRSTSQTEAAQASDENEPPTAMETM